MQAPKIFANTFKDFLLLSVTPMCRQDESRYPIQIVSCINRDENKCFRKLMHQFEKID